MVQAALKSILRTDKVDGDHNNRSKYLIAIPSRDLRFFNEPNHRWL